MVTFNAVPAHDTAASLKSLAGVSLVRWALSGLHAVMETLAEDRSSFFFAARVPGVCPSGGDVAADRGGTPSAVILRLQDALTGGSRA